MLRSLLYSGLLLACACTPAPGSVDLSSDLPAADTEIGLNEQAPMATTAATPPPPATSGEVSTYESTARSGAPTTYGQAAVLTPNETISGDEAIIMGLQGRWRNQTDEQEVLQFNADTYEVYFENEKVVEEAVSYHPNCPSDCTGGAAADYPCYVVSSPYHTDCFGIVRMTTNELELTILGQSTATVLYSRITP
ncbi:MAG: hypothetical protein AAF433_15380 [Bacteroidota bacterium]